MDSREPRTAPPVRGTITLAFGKQRYVEMGKSLGRSLKLNAPNLPRAVVTDSDDPELRALFTHIVPYRPDYGSDVRQKLHLDLYSPFPETLFIDSDCLVLNDLESFWTTFAGHYFGVPGWRELRRGDTDPWCDVDFLLDHFGIEALPDFNGGVYYFNRSEQATRFFESVRALLVDSEKLTFKRFREDAPADEAILSLAMALQGLSATSMGTGGMWTPASSRGPIRLDVQKGLCSFEKEGRMVYPEVVHFAGEYARAFAYVRECEKLARRFGGRRAPLSERWKTWADSIVWESSRGTKALAKRIIRGDAKPPSYAEVNDSR